MKYLVTGAAGNLARQIVEELLKRRHEVACIDLSEAPPSELDGCEYDAVDITDAAKLRSVVAAFRPERIVHMASLLSGTSEADPGRAWEVNASASVRLLEFAEEFGVSRMFFPSSTATYGGTVPDPVPEDLPQWPRNIYGATKIAIERVGSWYAFQKKVDFRSLRLPLVLSPYAPGAAVSAYASHSYRAAANGEPFAFPVEPHVGTSTVYVADVVNGILQYLDVDPEQLTRRVYNIHSFGPSAADTASAISVLIPDFAHEFAPDEWTMSIMGYAPKRYEDESARRDWGWSPTYDLAAASEDMIRRARAGL